MSAGREKREPSEERPDRFGAEADYLFTRRGTPPADLQALEALLAPYGYAAIRVRRRRRQRRLIVAAAALLVAGLGGLGVWLGPERDAEDRGAGDAEQAGYRVVSSSGGEVLVASKAGKGPWQPLKSGARIGAGEALRLAPRGRLRLESGRRVRLEITGPARLRCDRLDATGQHLELTEGHIDVAVEAGVPEAWFVIETPFGRVVDLGCAYTLDVDPQRGLEIRVTAGAVAHEAGDGTRILVPFAHALQVGPEGPGWTLSTMEVSAAFRQHIERWPLYAQKGPGAQAHALREALDLATGQDLLTLFQLYRREEEPALAKEILDAIWSRLDSHRELDREALARRNPRALEMLRRRITGGY